jgi:hypothetical protein
MLVRNYRGKLGIGALVQGEPHLEAQGLWQGGVLGKRYHFGKGVNAERLKPSRGIKRPARFL